MDRARLLPPLLLSLTLGLAPFTPEPHLVEKVRWILAGGEGMRAIDGFDLLMHGAPWVWLLVVLVGSVRGKGSSEAPAPR